MRNKTWMIFDVSSVLKRCYFQGKDKEFGFEVEFEGKKVHVNGWEHGRENFLNSVLATLREHKATPMDCIFVLEGEHGANLRRNIYDGYKRRPARAPEVGQEYGKVEDWLVSYFKNLGSIFVKQDGVEADDVVKYLAENIEGPKIIVMDDQDGLQLDDGKNTRVRYRSQLYNFGEDNPLGPFPHELNRLYKAVVGDDSDTLPGAKGFGPAKFIDLYVYAEVEGMQELERMVENAEWTQMAKDVQELLAAGGSAAKAGKALDLIVKSGDLVRKCYRCIGFMHQLVNAPGRSPLQWMPGMTGPKPDEAADPRLDHWFQTRTLITASNFSRFMTSGVWGQIRASRYVALDLETSSADESDDWLREINKQEEDADPIGVDVMGSSISGMGLTFGDNGQHTVYFTVDHATDNNVSIEQLYTFLSKLLEMDEEISISVHNSAFELPVLFNNLRHLTEKDERFDAGWLPRVEDTMFMASYVDENKPKGLKDWARTSLGYEQVEYDTVVTDPTTGRKRKMRDITPRDVFAYGTDDTIVTFALRNMFEAVMESERTWDAYAQVEMPAAYLACSAYVRGVKFNLEEMRRQEDADDIKYTESWAVVRDYLVKADWDGVSMPEVSMEAKSIKEIWKLVTGNDLDTKARTPSKMIFIMPEDSDDEQELKALYQQADKTGEMKHIEAYARRFFKGEPQLNTDSPKQMNRLFYEVMQLPERVRNKPTKLMKAKGEKGSLKTDSLAVATATYYDSETHPDQVAVLKHLHIVRGVNTRRKLYYRPYPKFIHWKTGKIHGSAGQCGARTRRFTPNKPNLAQLPVDQKKGDFRACFVAEKDYVILSFDFNAQELRLIADESGDPVMLSCYVGDNLRDMHHLTALKIIQDEINPKCTYEELAEELDNEDHPLHKVYAAARKKAKTVNFSSEYGAQGPKMAETLMVPLDRAEAYLDAKHSTFVRAEEWKKEEVIPEAKKKGYQYTRMGARRHLMEALQSDDWSTKSGAERQAVNFKIQGGSGEQTKLAMGRVWKTQIVHTKRVSFMFCLHDEVVLACHREDVLEVVPIIHGIMEMRYGGMKVPCKSSIGLGHNFRALIEIGMEAKPELIQKALDKLFPVN